jgi:CheY-like chemotaxis protein
MSQTHSGAGEENLEGITALVVDDHRDTLELAGMVLEWDGAEVLAAKSAEHALELLDTHRVDVVVCDIHLPRRDGRELVRALRNRSDEKRGIPALAISGDDDPSSIRQALAAGFDGFEAKPLDTSILVHRVRALVHREA